VDLYGRESAVANVTQTAAGLAMAFRDAQLPPMPGFAYAGNDVQQEIAVMRQ